MHARSCNNGPPQTESRGTLEPHAIARMLAVGGTFQELTASTPLVAPNQVFRIWRKGQSYVLKVYGSDARERRERYGHRVRLNPPEAL